MFHASSHLNVVEALCRTSHTLAHKVQHSQDALQPMHIFRTYLQLLHCFGRPTRMKGFASTASILLTTSTYDFHHNFLNELASTEMSSLLLPTTMSYCLHRSHFVHRQSFRLRFHWCLSYDTIDTDHFTVCHSHATLLASAFHSPPTTLLALHAFFTKPLDTSFQWRSYLAQIRCPLPTQRCVISAHCCQRRYSYIRARPSWHRLGIYIDN